MSEIHTHLQTLPKTYFEGIGRVAFQWNLVEVHLQTFVWHLMGLDWKQGRLLTFDKEAKQKIDMFAGLAEGWKLDNIHAAEVRSIANRALILNQRRNRIVHGVWGQTSQSRDRRLFEIANLKQRVLPIALTRDAASLVQVASDIKFLDSRLLKLHDQFGVQIP